MAILLLEIPAGLFPRRIDPAEPLIARHSSLLWIAADVLHDAVQVIDVADDTVEALLLPQFARLSGRGVDVPGGHSLHGSDQVFQFVAVERTQD